MEEDEAITEVFYSLGQKQSAINMQLCKCKCMELSFLNLFLFFIFFKHIVDFLSRFQKVSCDFLELSWKLIMITF